MKSYLPFFELYTYVLYSTLDKVQLSILPVELSRCAAAPHYLFYCYTSKTDRLLSVFFCFLRKVIISLHMQLP